MSQPNADAEKQPTHGEQPYHEEEDVNVGAIAWTTLGLIATLVVTGVVVWATRNWYAADYPNMKIAPRFEKVAKKRQVEPGVEIFPQRVLERVSSQNEERLHEYEWLDPQKRRARIPIERAIDLFEQRLPSAPEEESSP